LSSRLRRLARDLDLPLRDVIAWAATRTFSVALATRPTRFFVVQSHV
jgi:hypothetical protein